MNYFKLLIRCVLVCFLKLQFSISAYSYEGLKTESED